MIGGGSVLGRALRVAVALGFALAVSGCGTMIALTDETAPIKVYAGTRLIARHFAGGWPDLPLSFALDTALLPVTIPWTIVNVTRGEAGDGLPPAAEPK